MLKDKRWIAAFAVSLVAAVSGVHAARTVIPPVPMYVAHGAVGPMVLKDGRLGMEVRDLHSSVVDKLIAITDVVVPGGKGDRLVHVWRHDGHEFHRASESSSLVPLVVDEESATKDKQKDKGTVRLRSQLTGGQLPKNVVGSWTVDVETQDGQLVGRVAFNVVE